MMTYDVAQHKIFGELEMESTEMNPSKTKRDRFEARYAASFCN